MKYSKHIFICIGCLFLFSSCQQDIQSVRFDTLPDGTAVNFDTSDLDGTQLYLIENDEYFDRGFLVFTSPQEDCAAISGGPTPDIMGRFLGYSRISSCANVNRLEIEFIEPVRYVDLSFIGARTQYNIHVIDPEGEIIASPSVRCAGTLDISHLNYKSSKSNIQSVSFGTLVELPLTQILIDELNFEY